MTRRDSFALLCIQRSLDSSQDLSHKGVQRNPRKNLLDEGWKQASETIVPIEQENI